MGPTAPALGATIFYDVTTNKNVTVKVPANATGYGTSPTDATTENWGNKFRGGILVNSRINLTIEYMED
jgi:hypothetical protein